VKARSLPKDDGPPFSKTVRAKRRASSPGAIRRKAEAGEATGMERAVMRIGRSNTKVITGQDDLSDWTDEELRQGRRLSKNETFVGRPPKMVPKVLHDELVRRTIAGANDLMRDNLEAAVMMLVKLAKSPAVEAKDRLRAINMIMERVMGKSPDKVEITGNAPWMVALQAGIVQVNGDGEQDDYTDEEIEDAEWEDE
jgi:hypothetical protein